MQPNTQSNDPTPALISAVARLRREHDLTLEDLADRAGLHRTSLGLVERGERGLSLDSAARIANAFDLSFGRLVTLAEAETGGITPYQTALSPRRLPPSTTRHEDELHSLTGLEPAAIRSAIEHTYDTLDLIDTELIAKGSEPISKLVELANLSSMVGNLVGAGLADASGDLYKRNRPHAFPDLVPQRDDLPDLELKTALETNYPKGHLAKSGVYMTFRYVLGGPNGEFTRGKDNRGHSVWIWEVRVGELQEEDFSVSNTAGDSGKTAVIKTLSFINMYPVLFDDRFYPYARDWGGLTKSVDIQLEI